MDAAQTRGSIVIPAHNEESVIGRCLTALEREGVAGLEVVVVANGCHDATASAARAYSDRIPGLQVIELAQGSKIAALNAGDDVVHAFPRVYLDADIELENGALRALMRDLTTEDALVASPAVRFDTAGASVVSRYFFEAFSRLPYVRRDLVGLGVYAVSESGRRRFGRFPDVTADDLFVQQLFSSEERRSTSGAFVVRVPRRARNLVRVRARGTDGARELAELGISPHPLAEDGHSTGRALAGLVLSRPWLMPHAVVYTAVMVAARLRARGTRGSWLRDDSSRPLGRTSAGPVAYLVTDYPKLSHTFIEREVVGLRELGVDVRTYSVHPPDPRELLSRSMRQEAARTAVLVPSKAVALRAVVGFATRHPIAISRLLGMSSRLGAPGLRSHLWQVFYSAEAVVLVGYLRAVGAHHVHVHLANNAADIARLAVRLGELLDGPIAGWGWSLTMHGPTEFEAVERYDLAAKVESAAAVACISDFTRSQLMRLVGPEHWGKLSVVRMSVDSEVYRPRPRTQSVGALRVLFVGRLVAEKGVLLLLDVVEALRARGVQVELRVVGDGPLAGPLAKDLRRRRLDRLVTLLGPRGQDELPDLIAASDVLCLPSFQEGLPVVLMEALASAVPVVTTRVNGIPELVVDGVTGRLVTPGRADLLADALADLATDPALREQLGLQGRIKIEKEFAVEVTSRAQRDFLDHARRLVR